MKFETTFDIGDTGYTLNSYSGVISQVTIGQIRIKLTDHKVLPQDEQDYEEEYMCVETGVGCGTVYLLGKRIFKTREQCEEYFAEEIKRLEKEAFRKKKLEEVAKLSKEESLLAQLYEIEQIKKKAYDEHVAYVESRMPYTAELKGE